MVNENKENEEIKETENIEQGTNTESQLTEEEIKKKEHEKIVNRRLTFANILILTFTAVFCAFFVFSVVVTKMYDSATIVGTSMSPTMNAYALIDGSTDKNDVAYYTYHKSAKINDIIIVDYSSTGSHLDAIKRLIAKGGDTICFYNGKILKNGSPLEEPYLDAGYNYIKNNVSESSADEWKNTGFNQSKLDFEKLCSELLIGKVTYNTPFAQNCKADISYCARYITYSLELGTYVMTIPEDYVFFLGDNRAVSNDSSCFGPLESSAIVAKVDFILSYNANAFTKLFSELNYIFA